ncbi:MAG: Na(+)-translocating NADH-quinone reductase subunit B [Vicingaceae bacterium]|nr:MAG: Na(+)-translocating NADH-quinone reductase subunit B [Vicingaceae bacterium]
MKALEKFMQKIKPDPNAKFPLAYWMWDGFYTFLFVPGHTTHSGAHIRDAVDLKRTMFSVIIALIPCLLFGIYNTGYQHYIAQGITNASFGDIVLVGLGKVLPLIVVSYVVGLGIEFIFCAINRHPIQEGFLVSGLLIPLIMPADVPLWMVAVSTAFAVIFAKEVFGGTGMNFVNVALVARAFLFFAYPTMISGTSVWYADAPFSGTVDAVTGATALGDAAANMPIQDFTAKYSLMDSFIGLIPGSIGETSALACLLGGLFLLITGVASWRVMLSVFLGGWVMASIFNAFGANTLMQIPALHHLVIGGFAFGAVFMATDPVTAAQTNTGKYIYGFLIGVFAILIRVFNPAYPEGMMLAILFMNVMAPLIDHYVIQANIKRRLARKPVIYPKLKENTSVTTH